MERAAYVCAICKARKKACDKHVPKCGYCKKRSLNCSYSSDQGLPAGNDAESGLPFLSVYAPSELTGRKSTLKPNFIFNDQRSGVPTHKQACSLDMMLNLHVKHTMQAAGLTPQTISDKYFHGFHVWLPVVCPRMFERACSHYIVPPADISILTLAIHLITLRPRSAFPHRPTEAGVEHLYLFVKMLASQVQAEICGSIPLLQASLLIAAYEYASGKPKTAYISLSSCSAMAYILGVNEYRDPQTLTSEDDRLESRQSWNIWWGLVILQRYFYHPLASLSQCNLADMSRLVLIELPRRTAWPRAKFPTPEAALPSDLAYNDRSMNWSKRTPLLNEARLLTSQEPHIVGFGRQAQAVELYDKLLNIIELKSEYEVTELKKLDGEAQAFMKVVMNESGKGNWNFRSGIEATMMR